MPTKCPNCAAGMEPVTLEGHLAAWVTIDQCAGCHAFWFDRRESLQLTPAATLKLFSLIGDARSRPHTPISVVIKCPRCASRLVETHDRQRNTAFRYWRCPHDHGRFITFFEFLREKDFIRPLSAKQLEELRRTIQTVNCSNCGAPIDVTAHAECAHCGSPLSLLDLGQAEHVIEQLKRADEPKPVDPALPLELARARREVNAAFAGSDDWWRDASSFGLVEAGLAAMTRLLKKRM